jgi:hypothetical protein
MLFCTMIDSIHTDHPLAQNFDILKGHVMVKVPKVKPGKKFALVRECKRSIWESSNVLITILVQYLATQETSLQHSRKFFCVDVLE